MLFWIKKVLKYLIGKMINYRVRNYFKPVWWNIHHPSEPYYLPPFRFATSIFDRDGFFYIEDDNYYIISAELVASGRTDRRLVASYIRQCPDVHGLEPAWVFLRDPSRLAEEVEDSERWRIMTNVCAYYDRRGITYEVLP